MSYVPVTQDAQSKPARQLAPAFTLIFLAPLIAEVLSGATRVSFLFAFVPEMMMWGCGTLIIRELVKRWDGGWTSVLLLALALAVFEECVVQQTSLAPLPWPAISANYGRRYGVNWIYLLYMLGYESVWVVVVPIQVTELIFPEWREERWLRTGCMMTSVVVFLARNIERGDSTTRTAPPPWSMVAAAVVFGFPWYRLMVLIFGERPTQPFW